MSRLLLLVAISTFALPMASYAADSRKPTLVVVIPGWSSGDGRRIEPDGLHEVADNLQNDLSKRGTPNHAIMYKWPSHNSNGASTKDLAKKIRAQADKMGGDVNLIVVGHSRGGILAHDVLSQVGEDQRFGYVQGVLLDATAARPMGDKFPTKKPAGVDSLYNYVDGKSFDQTGLNANHEWLKWNNTDSDHNIEGAENITILGSGHTEIVDDFLSNEYDDGPIAGFTTDNGLSEVPEEEQPKHTRETEQPPVKDDERVLSQFDKAIDDTVREIQRFAADASDGDISLDPTSRLKEMERLPEHWGGMADTGGKHLGGLGTRAYEATGNVLQDFRDDPVGASKRAAKWTQEEAEHLGGHYQRMGTKYGEHWGGMIEHGGKHAGNALAKSAKEKVFKPAGEQLAKTESKIRGSLSDAEHATGKSLSSARDRAVQGANSAVDRLEDFGGELEKPLRKVMPRVPSAKSATDKAKSLNDYVTKRMPRVPSTKDVADKGKDLGKVVTKRMPRIPTDKELGQKGKSIGDHIAKRMPRVPSSKSLSEKGSSITKSLSKQMPRVPSAKDVVDQGTDLGQQIAKRMPRVLGKGSTPQRASDAWNEGRQQVGNAWNDGRQLAGNAWNDGRQQVGNAWNDGRQQVGNAWNDGRQQVGNAWNDGRQQAGNAWNDGRQQVGNAWNDGRQQVGNAWNQGREQFGNPWNDGRNQFGKAWNSGRENGQKFWNDFATGLNNAIQQQQWQREQAAQVQREALAARQRAYQDIQRNYDQAERTIRNVGGSTSSWTKNQGGRLSDFTKQTGGRVSDFGKQTGGRISQGAKDFGGQASQGAKDFGGAVSSGFKSLTGGGGGIF